MRREELELSDLVTAIEGLGFEIEALNMTLRDISANQRDAAGELIVANIPEWVNRSPESPENGPQAPGRAWARVRPQAPARGNLGAGAGLVVIGACLGLVCVMLALVYFVGS